MGEAWMDEPPYLPSTPVSAVLGLKRYSKSGGMAHSACARNFFSVAA